MAETTLQGTLRRALGGVGTNVLLVTDEPPASGIVAAALAQEGFAVEATCNGDDALRRLQAGPPVDVMITEIALPGGMDGAALARRARELRPDLPIVYTSQRRCTIGKLDPVEGAMFVAKPYDPTAFGRLLQYLVVARRTRAGGWA
jgi:DNA-binding response OmpR family regulator